jgi:anti-sigma regulatory factor (Ser/Thr protein kinase)
MSESVRVTKNERTLRLSRRDSALDEARRFADLAVRQCSEACREAVALAVTELGENLLKYGEQTDPAHAGTIGVGIEGNRIRVRAVSGVHSSDDARSVAGIVGKLARPDPGAGALYRDRLRELFENPALEKAQLGLIRLAFEGGFRLSYSFAPPELEIVAERQCGTGT